MTADQIMAKVWEMYEAKYESEAVELYNQINEAVHNMSTLEDFRLGGYHNAGGGMTGEFYSDGEVGTPATNIEPLPADVRAFVDHLPLPPRYDWVTRLDGSQRVWSAGDMHAFAVQAIEQWEARKK